MPVWHVADNLRDSVLRTASGSSRETDLAVIPSKQRTNSWLISFSLRLALHAIGRLWLSM